MKSFVAKICLILVMLFSAGVFVAMPVASVEASGLQGKNRLDMGKDFGSNLTRYEGEKVTLHMKSGVEFEGKLRSVKNGMVLLELKGSRVDVLLRLDDVVAFELVRGYQR